MGPCNLCSGPMMVSTHWSVAAGTAVCGVQRFVCPFGFVVSCGSLVASPVRFVRLCLNPWEPLRRRALCGGAWTHHSVLERRLSRNFGIPLFFVKPHRMSAGWELWLGISCMFAKCLPPFRKEQPVITKKIKKS